MAKKQTRTSRKTRPVPGTAIPEPIAEDRSLEEPQRWIDLFGSRRLLFFMVGASLVLAAMLFGAAALDGLTAVKLLLAKLLGSADPHIVNRSNTDIATVLWGMGSVALLGAVHPVLGVALLLLGRSWLDGYTYFLDNMYFTWCIYLLWGQWLLRVFKKKDRLYLPVPALLFAVFLIWVLITTPASLQPFNTYQQLWLWLAYGLLFLLCINLCMDKHASRFLLTIFLVALSMQALFAILHFEFLLPHLRRLVQDPAILRQYFKTDVISAEMARRFMVNRAFGSMLFPNALAAYLLLGTPFLLIMSLPYLRRFKERLQQKALLLPDEGGRRERNIAIALALTAGFALFLFIQFVVYFPIEYRDTSLARPWYFNAVPLHSLALAGSVSGGALILYLLLRRGIVNTWIILRTFVVPILALMLLYTLWITYSRGALAAFILAMVWAALLYFLGAPIAFRLGITLRPKKAVLLILLLSALILISLAAADLFTARDSWAQPTAPASAAQTQGAPMKAAPTKAAPRSTAPRGSQVREEGITLSMGDLADPASFKLRLGYWRVTLSIARHHLLTGIGLGNFSIAYPRYQYIGAGDVREGHNGFLQAFAETGFVGGLCFLVFWLWILISGALRILREEERHQKCLLLGIYTGLVAFALHSFVDINFSHPSLAMFGMVWAGLFLGIAAQTRPAQQTDTEEESYDPAQDAPRRGAVFWLSALITGAAIAASLLASLSLYLQQVTLNRLRLINISADNDLSRRMESSLFFFHQVAGYGMKLKHGEKNVELPRIPLANALAVLPDVEQFKEGCLFYRPDPNQVGRFVKLEPQEEIPANALMTVVRPWMIRNRALDACMRWVKELEEQDRRFPYSPLLALYIARWYELYVSTTGGPRYADHWDEWTDAFMNWSDIYVQRNPTNADLRCFRANAWLWHMEQEDHADVEETARKIEAEYDFALALSPITPQHRYMYKTAMERLAAYAEKEEQAEYAARCLAKAQEMEKAAKQLEQDRLAVHLYK